MNVNKSYRINWALQYEIDEAVAREESDYRDAELHRIKHELDGIDALLESMSDKKGKTKKSNSWF